MPTWPCTRRRWWKVSHANDLMRHTLERILGGMLAYGMPGYRCFDLDYEKLKIRTDDYPQWAADTAPSLLIAACDYVRGTDDVAWLKKNYAGIKQWADSMLATDKDKNGLIEYYQGTHFRPANWWDDILVDHEDAYSNALAYRALGNMEEMAGKLGKTADAARYRAAADKLRAAYYDAFFNPATGVLAGWRPCRWKASRLLLSLCQRHCHPLRAGAARQGQCDHGPTAGKDETGRLYSI